MGGGYVDVEYTVTQVTGRRRPQQQQQQPGRPPDSDNPFNSDDPNLISSNTMKQLTP